MNAFALGSGSAPSLPLDDPAAFKRKASPALPMGRVHAVHRRNSLMPSARRRLFLLVGCFALAALVGLLRIGHLGLVGSAPSQTSLADALLPPRGEITDRNGTALARTFPAYALCLSKWDRSATFISYITQGSCLNYLYFVLGFILKYSELD